MQFTMQPGASFTAKCVWFCPTKTIQVKPQTPISLASLSGRQSALCLHTAGVTGSNPVVSTKN
ncbi:MAG: hypothetical protein VW236_08525, partial [Flavobacteriaceae bacterium]